MGCDKLKPPEPPQLDASKLPSGLSLPDGQSPEQFAAKASKNSLIPDAISGAENLIDKNVKSISEGLNPQAIGEKIGESLAGITNTVTGMVDEAVAGVSGLVDSIANIGNKTKKINSPEGIAGSVKSKLPGAGAVDAAKKKCEEEYLNKASKLKADMKAKADSAAASLSSSQKKLMASDPEYKEQVMSEIKANVESETLQQVAEDAKKVDKKTRSVQDNMQTEKLTVISAVDGVSVEKISKLLVQMSYYQTKMYQTLRSIAISTTSIIQDEVGAGRFESPPILDMWKIVHGTINFKVYAKLAKDLSKQWEKLTAPTSPVDGPDAEWDAYGSGEMIAFKSWIQFERPGLYADWARPNFFDPSGARRTGKWMTKEYFELWSGESWMLDDSLNSNGITQDQKNIGQIGPIGLLSVDTGVLEDLMQEAGRLNNIADDQRTPQQNWTLETGIVLTQRKWYGVYDYNVTGRGWRDQQYTPTQSEQLKTFVYGTQQQEILKIYGETDFFDMNPEDTSTVYIGVDNNVTIPTQLYNKNFLVKANINWSDNTVTSIEAGGVDTDTEQAVNT